MITKREALDRALDMANEAVTWAATDAYVSMAFSEAGHLFTEIYDRLDPEMRPPPGQPIDQIDV